MRNCFGLLILSGALLLSAASSGSNQNASGSGSVPPAYGGGNGGPVTSQPMSQDEALGLWKSSFGAVKIERDPSRPGSVRGVWVYDRGGQEVIGFFAGALSGNTLSFSWEEPTSTGVPLGGGGYLTFDAASQSFGGKWWTANRDRGGDWRGWRGDGSPDSPDAPDQGPDDGGGEAEQAPDSPDFI